MLLKEYVYESLQGTLIAPHPEVKNLFEDGMPCEKWYDDMLKAYQRIWVRLGTQEEDDDDVEIIITCLRRIERAVAFQMFNYGAKFERENLSKIKVECAKQGNVL